MFNHKKILFIGDPHFKINNGIISDVFAAECVKSFAKYPDALCVIGGDVLDTHERLHQTPYNRALKFIDDLSKIGKVIVLVGNHDYENNQQFLSDRHWMNPLKKWSNVSIVDSPLHYDGFVFCPYVPPGRFLEALDTLEDVDWRSSRCIFAHQEFRGCVMGVTVSENGDKWNVHYPTVVSGHIHKPHSPQANIIYPGSVIQHNFGEENSENNGLLLIDFGDNFDEFKMEKISIEIPRIKTLTIECEDFEKTVKNLTIKPLERIRIMCKGVEEQFRRIRKTNLFNKLPQGVCVNFKTEKEIQNKEEMMRNLRFETFDEALKKRIKNSELASLYDAILKGSTFEELRIITPEDNSDIFE